MASRVKKNIDKQITLQNKNYESVNLKYSFWA